MPLNVLNLPFRVTVPNTGLNGILITEQQDGRDFIIEADPAAAPLEQTLYVTARAEVNSGEPNERASTPIILRILPAAGTPTAARGRRGSSGSVATAHNRRHNHSHSHSPDSSPLLGTDRAD